ncbi:unnamed protein product, partial [Prorocentrum cordatum]
HGSPDVLGGGPRVGTEGRRMWPPCSSGPGCDGAVGMSVLPLSQQGDLCGVRRRRAHGVQAGQAERARRGHGSYGAAKPERQERGSAPYPLAAAAGDKPSASTSESQGEAAAAAAALAVAARAAAATCELPKLTAGAGAGQTLYPAPSSSVVLDDPLAQIVQAAQMAELAQEPCPSPCARGVVAGLAAGGQSRARWPRIPNGRHNGFSAQWLR